MSIWKRASRRKARNMAKGGEFMDFEKFGRPGLTGSRVGRSLFSHCPEACRSHIVAEGVARRPFIQTQF